MDFRERYEFNPKQDLIGKGGFSKVYKAYDVVRKRTMALKFYYGAWSDRYDIIGEINRMEDIVHPNLIRYYDATIIKSTSALGEEEKIQVGIMEYADAGDITECKSIKELGVLKKVIIDVLKGLNRLHQEGIIHRDLKPKNILLSTVNGELTAKIGDFGISKKMGSEDNSASSQLLGSVEYMAPEQFNPKKYGIDGQLHTNVDLWSLGIIIYEILTKETPFGSRSTGLSNEQVLSNILFNDLKIDLNLVPEPFKMVVRQCLVKEASARAQDANALIGILEGNEVNVPVQAEKIVQPKPPKAEENTGGGQPTDSILLDFERIPPAEIKPKPEVVPQPARKRQSYFTNQSSATQDVITKSATLAKKYFQEGNYVRSFALLKDYRFSPYLDTESKFYLGFMLYNGKCGGAHDYDEGKEIMKEARRENRALVTELMVKYVV